MKLNEETILNYLDGHLNEQEEKAFMEAVEADKEIKKLFMHHKEIHTSLEQEELHSPSAGFADRVMDAVYQLHATRTKFFNRSRLFVIGLIGIILITTVYYLSIKFYPSLGSSVANDITIREFTVDLNPAKTFLDSDVLFKVVFYINGIVSLFLLDRAVLKPFFARRRERYSM
jgi:hypothetical protein